MSDPFPSQPAEPRRSAADTQPIPILGAQAQVPPPELPRIQLAPTPPAPLPARPARSKAWRYWLGGVAAVLLLAGAAASYYLQRPVQSSERLLGAAPQAKDIPAVLRPYYDRAQNGDVVAMRMLATMYYNGLNVPQDTREGVRWYRKAAAAGSEAARKDLEQLGVKVEEP